METRSNHVLVGAVVLILLAMLALFTVWLARLGGKHENEYDIFFPQSVDGLTKGSEVAYSGVPSGTVKQIQLWKPDPNLVRVRIAVDPDTPVLQGTKAAAQCSFTGTCTVQLDGATKGAAPIVCPNDEAGPGCRMGVPEIPPKAGGFGALLASAPKLLENLSNLTDRLTVLLGDENQNSIKGILANTNRLSGALADRGPEIAATLAQTRVAIQQAGDAAQKIGDLANTTNGLVAQNVKPTFDNLNATIASAKKAADALNDVIGSAKPGLSTFSRDTIPEVNRLVHDLRQSTQALSSISD
jgi:phospholipid/cholesterol/gamma-HCH transport system substrate-binding protein